MVVKVCDRCKSTLNMNDRHCVNRVMYGNYGLSNPDYVNKHYAGDPQELETWSGRCTADLCPTCAKEFVQWMNGDVYNGYQKQQSGCDNWNE